MKLLKFILFAIALVLAVLLGFSIIGFIFGFIYSALWYLFWIGVLAIAGYAGYKMLKKGDNLEIEGRDSVSQIELENAKVVKSLEELKRKYTK